MRCRACRAVSRHCAHPVLVAATVEEPKDVVLVAVDAGLRQGMSESSRRASESGRRAQCQCWRHAGIQCARRGSARCHGCLSARAGTHTHNSFVEGSIEAGLLLSGNGALRTIEAPSAPSG